MTTYTFESLSNLVRGKEMKRNGIKGTGSLVAWKTDEEKIPVVLVVAWKGYGENPGSRYSMLHSYYPAETAVYVYSHTDKFDRRHFTHVIEWQTKSPKKS